MKEQNKIPEKKMKWNGDKQPSWKRIQTNGSEDDPRSWKFQVNRTMQYMVLYVWLLSLSMMLLRLTFVTYDSSLFLLIAELYFIGWIYHISFIQYLVDGHLDCF